MDQAQQSSRKLGSVWKASLVLLAIGFFIVAVVLEALILFADYSKVVTTDGDVVTTTTRGSAPSAGLVTGSLGLAVVCLLVAALADRITKISVAGVDIEFSAVLAAKVAELTIEHTRANPEKFFEVYVQALDSVTRGAVDPELARTSKLMGEGAVIEAAVLTAANERLQRPQ